MKTSGGAKFSALIVAAEASSSLYAQRLLEHWRAQDQDIQTFGIGSRSMEALGFECLGRSEELAVVGIQEVIAHWGDIKAAYHGLLKAAAERKPKFALLLDYPDFNLRLARDLKKLGIPVVYYVSPQIWAWRQGRVKIIQERVDKMLVLFPFEKEFYAKHGVNVSFVGHPLLDEIKDQYFSEEHRQMRRSRYGVQKHERLLALMPGSRRSELNHHLEVQLQTAELLWEKDPALKIAIFVAPTFDVEQIRARLPNMKFPLILIQDEPFDMIQLADAVLCASGTATLMVGLLERPLVVMYRMNALTAWLAKTFVRSTKYFGMINLVLDQEVAREYFQEKASPEILAGSLRPLLYDEQEAARVQSLLHQARSRLGDKGATVRVAREVEEYLRS